MMWQARHTPPRGGWTLTGTARRKLRVKAIRMEWTGPRIGDLAWRAKRKRRPPK